MSKDQNGERGEHQDQFRRDGLPVHVCKIDVSGQLRNPWIDGRWSIRKGFRVHVEGFVKHFPCFFKEMLETAGVAPSGARRIVLYKESG